MATITIAEKSIKINKGPVVVLPLKKWVIIESELEDLEMYRSKKLPKEIAKARKEIKEGKFFTFAEIKKKLKLS